MRIDVNGNEGEEEEENSKEIKYTRNDFTTL